MINFDAFSMSGEPRYAEWLVKRWFNRAKSSIAPHQTDRERDRDNYLFEQFIQLWISFNGWGMRVTSARGDRSMITSLAGCERLSIAFANMIAEDEKFRTTVCEFAQYWPIFSVLDIHNLSATQKESIAHQLAATNSRSARAEVLLRADRVGAELRHGPENECDPANPTWRMALEAIYQVRSNLFHGNKGDAEEDTPIIRGAFNTLFQFVDKQGVYEWRDQAATTEPHTDR